MIFLPVGAVFGLFTLAFLLGGLPIIGWLVRGLAGIRLSELGTGNLSVSAAFYHGGTVIGLLAVLSEALKGIGVVLLARSLFVNPAPWEIFALIALVLGRFIYGRGAGTTNVVWGYIVHDWVIALVVFALSGGWFAIARRRQQGRLGVLVLLPIVEAFRRPESPTAIVAATLLSLLIAWIYRQIPDDLALSTRPSTSGSRKIFQYLRGRDVISSLNDKPNSALMGQKAATLAQLKQWGYAIPAGWILPVGASPRSLITHLESADTSPWQHPWIVRSSSLDEDRGDASAAGQYESVPGNRSASELAQAIEYCRASYKAEGAAQYRRDRGLENQAGMALLVQRQVTGIYAGVAFSRDPVNQGEAVVVEAVAGGAEQVVSGQVTPEQYRIEVDEAAVAELSPPALAQVASSVEPDLSTTSSMPSALLQRVAELARHLELRFHGIPQDVEWSFDGETLWLLQARPITTLAPLWTRKIAAEVIPGVICPLTWSINRPLTCGVWGDIFTIVLGDRASGLDFGETAKLHYSRAYFNATLLGRIFCRMGLPPESLEFLTLGAKFSKPPLLSTLKNVPGLLRLLRREWRLDQDFEQDDRRHFSPILDQLHQIPAAELDSNELLDRIDQILSQLKRVTYYSILAPLSFSLRRAVLQVPETELDQSRQPEVASVQAVKALVQAARQQYPHLSISAAEPEHDASLDNWWTQLAALPEGPSLCQQLDAVVEEYGYLSEVGTDIAVPTWHEDPQPVRALFAQFWQTSPAAIAPGQADSSATAATGWRYQQVQKRLNLKGRVATVYLKLLAELRWALLALEQQAIAQNCLQQIGDAFFLTDNELRNSLSATPPLSAEAVQALVVERRSQFEQHQQLATVPFVVYGNDPPPDPSADTAALPPPQSGQLQGIGASAGQVQGTVKVLHSLQRSTSIAPNTIIVVPYTDAGWAPLLAQAAGLVAEVGGRLSHGAIVAREYKIPAVMNIANATQRFQDGQIIRIDGRAGTVEWIES